MNIVIAPNAFKNSLDAPTAAEKIAAGLRESSLDANLLLMPVADGGDGTMEVFHSLLGGEKIEVACHDPLMRKIKAQYLVTDDGEAVVEMAEASGIRLLKENEYNPLKATTFGTGELIKDAVSRGCKTIYLGLGGSATMDAGLGILYALGLKIYDEKGNEIWKGAEAVGNIQSFNAEQFYENIRDIDFKILCDVQNALLGEEGAARVFGPQKGAADDTVKAIESFYEHFSNFVKERTGKSIGTIKHGGAAGGIVAGMKAFAEVEAVEGAQKILEIAGFDNKLEKADLVITGEGALDDQSLHGKAPVVVAELALKYRVPTINLSGNVPVSTSPEIEDTFIAVFPIVSGPSLLEEALTNAEDNLYRTAKQLGRVLAFMKSEKN